MSFKDLGKKTPPQPHAETPAEAAIREKAAAHHKAKEEKHAAHETAAAPPPGPAKPGPARH
jgi:hypothetical protein